MSVAQVFLMFKLYVASAAIALGVQVPEVKHLEFAAAREVAPGITVGTVAFVAVRKRTCSPGFDCDQRPTVIIMEHTLEAYVQQRGSARAQVWLECIARHEVAHVALGHHALEGNLDDDFRHNVVRLVMRDTWKQDSTCEF